MNQVLLLIVFIFLYTFADAQQKAVTEEGEEVILYGDGTWAFQDENYLKEIEILVNPNEFTKSENSSFLLKSKKLNIGIWLDPKIWSFSKSNNNTDSEYEFQSKEGDLYGMIITEKFEIPLESLRIIAFENAKEESPDIRVINEEYRTVNGLKVLYLQMNGTMQGIKFSYNGYYYASTEGSVQFVTFTSQKLMEEFKSLSEELLNGLVERE